MGFFLVEDGGHPVLVANVEEGGNEALAERLGAESLRLARAWQVRVDELVGAVQSWIGIPACAVRPRRSSVHGYEALQHGNAVDTLADYREHGGDTKVVGELLVDQAQEQPSNIHDVPMLGATHDADVLRVGPCLFEAWELLFEIRSVIETQFPCCHVDLSRPCLAGIKQGKPKRPQALLGQGEGPVEIPWQRIVGGI